MARFLFTTLPSNDLGLLTRSLPVARELGKRGHGIAFCNPGYAPQQIITEAGFENFLPDSPLYYLIAGDISLRSIFRFLSQKKRLFNLRRAAGLVERMLFQYSTTQVWDVDHFMSLLGMMDAGFIQANVDILLDLMARTRAEAVVDFWNPYACIAARIRGIPLITVIQADLHPHSKGFIWWSTPPVDLPRPAPIVNTVLEKYGQPPVKSVGELLIGDLTLVVGMPETDPLPESADVQYVGALLWEKPSAKLPSWIDELDSNQPLIWVYTGNPRYLKALATAFDSSVVLQACLEALGNQPLQVVLTTGYQPIPRKFFPLPPNFHFEPFLPGLAMAERSDLMIHHGGYGSCQTGLYAGTPALIIPTYSERESNARRIASLGAADFLVPETDKKGKKKYVPTAELRNKTYAILQEKSYTAIARSLSEKLKAYGGASLAARLIETHLTK